jgi:hypothetical protein
MWLPRVSSRRGIQPHRLAPHGASVLQAGGKPMCSGQARAPAQHNIALRAMRSRACRHARTERLNAGRVTECYVWRPRPAVWLRVNARLFVSCGASFQLAPQTRCGAVVCKHTTAPVACPRPPHSLRHARRGSPSFAASLACSLVPPPPRGAPILRRAVALMRRSQSVIAFL